MSPGGVVDGEFVRFLFHHHERMRARTRIALTAPAATPIPVFAPGSNPEDDVGSEETVGFESTDWKVLSGGVSRVLKARADVLIGLEDGVEVVLEIRLAAVIALDRMIVVGLPADLRRNLPIPVSQQLIE